MTMSTYRTVFDTYNKNWVIMNMKTASVHSKWDTEKEARLAAFDLNHWPTNHILEVPNNVIPFRRVAK